MARVRTKHDVASNRDHPIARTKTSNHICGILLRLNEQEPGCPHLETPVQYLYTYHDPDMSDEPAQFIDSVFRMAGLEEPRLEPGEDFLTYVSRPKDTVVLHRSADVSRAGPRNAQENHAALPYALPPSLSRPAHGRPTPPVFSSLPSAPVYSQHGARIPGPAHVTTQYGPPTYAETRLVNAPNNVAKALLLLHNPEQANKPMRRREALPPRFRNL